MLLLLLLRDLYLTSLLSRRSSPGDVNVGGGSRLAGIVVYEETAYNCLCNLLVDAVSEANPRRKEFIGLIMKMDKSAQKSLMRIIKDGKVMAGGAKGGYRSAEAKRTSTAAPS